MLKTPAGRPASWNSSQISIGAEGSRSDGFRMKVFPHAMATGNIHIGTMAGKLKGVMPATTPSGWRSDQLSISGPTLRLNSPLSRCGIPQAKSTTSIPRASSPSASACVLPCSREIARAISSAFFSRSSLNLKNGRTRFIGGIVPHEAAAALAAATAALRSSDARQRQPCHFLARRRIEDGLRARGMDGGAAAVDGILDHLH